MGETKIDNLPRQAAPSVPRVVVVGGGFTGLAAAYEFAKRNLRPTLIEAEAELGGLAGTFPVGETRLERFYHHWLFTDRHAQECITRIRSSNSHHRST